MREIRTGDLRHSAEIQSAAYKEHVMPPSPSDDTRSAPGADPTGGYAAHRFVAEFYDHVDLYRARPDVGFYVDEARRAGGPILELGCGTGRVLIPTSRAGLSITGLDLAGPMLELCRSRLAEEPRDVQERVDLVEADMRRFDLGRDYALVTIPFRPFQHLLTVDDQLACLESARRHLCDGGRLVFDLFNPSLPMLMEERFSREFGEEPEVVLPDGRRVLRRMRRDDVDFHRQIVQSELIYYVTHPGGWQERRIHSFPLRYLFRFEAEHLLVRAGFTVENFYADFERRPFGAHPVGELIFVARRA
ncbi:MAG: methyltransferase domain-containing protein [Candidatus Eisenbacteria bacterium]|nr:methyltransferase domain-containing protein [Candidatus Eisenbacteria bacterium]